VRGAPAPASPWLDEASNLVRAIAGGMLFGIPLLYTVEVWDIGASISPAGSALVLSVTFVIVLLLVGGAGFHDSKQRGPALLLAEAAEALAVGVLAVTVMLVLLSELTSATPLAEAVGKVVLEAAPFAMGAAVACHLLSGAPDEPDLPDTGAAAAGRLRGTVADLGATLVGAVFVGFNIAPTEEVPRLAAASPPGKLLAIMVFSLLLSYSIVFQAGFRNQARRREQRGILQHPVTETVASYVVALLASAAMLVLFGSLETGDSWSLALDHVLLLGLPASIGGAAGRLAI
jgi:putative integral membrane protein (TIGR02587 family)